MEQIESSNKEYTAFCNIYNQYFMFKWDKLSCNIHPNRIPFHIINY